MINSYDSCGSEEIPQIGGERGMDSRKYGDVVIFEGADSALGEV